MNILWQDTLFGLRMLAKRPVLTAVAALSLALGIGLNTAIFALVNTILLGSLPLRDPDRVVVIWCVPPGNPDQLNGASVPDYLAWKERSRSFEGMGAMVVVARDFGAEQNGMPAERIRGEMYTPEMLTALGFQPLMGRLFTPSEAEVDHPAPVVVISYRLWQQRFGGDKNILNHTVLFDGINTNIIGVMRPGFVFSDEKAEFLIPFSFNHFQVRGSGRFMLVAGRLKPGVSMRQAQSEMESVAVHFAAEHPADLDHGKAWSVHLQPVRDALYGFMNRPLLLQGAVAFVLLIACANVAALLVARAAARRNEVAIRAALGAGRMRIVRQFLTESLLLSLAGGAFGVLLAWWGVRVLVSMAPSWLPRLQEISIGGRVLVFSVAISVLTGIVFGLAPATQGWRISFAETLKDAIRGGTSGGAHRRFLAVLVTAQLALAMVLLIGSGLLIRSFLKVEAAGINRDPAGLLTFVVQFSEQRYGKPLGQHNGLPLWEINPVAQAKFQQLYERMQALPGVESAAASVLPPMTGGAPMDFEIVGRAATAADAPSATYTPITPNFFHTMKIRMERGRDFNMHDTAGSNWVMIVNETMAKRFWPKEDPIGKSVKLDLSPDEQPREIVGVVEDTPGNPLQPKQDPEMYVPFFQAAPRITGPWTGFRLIQTYLLRAKGDPMSLLPAVRRAVAEVDANLPIQEAKTEDQWLSVQVEYPRYFSMLLGLFAFVATVLAAVGIYGVMSYAVEQRTREIGIRMALGAGRWDVFSLVIRRATWLIAGGLVLGTGSAIALTRFLSSELWEVQAMDPAIFASVSLSLAVVAGFACLIPTWRAVRVDPTVTLHYE